MTIAPRAAGAVSGDDSVAVYLVARDGRPGLRLGWCVVAPVVARRVA